MIREAAHIGHTLKITEIRKDMVICQGDTLYVEVMRHELEADVDPELGDRVNFNGKTAVLVTDRARPHHLAPAEKTVTLPSKPDPPEAA